MGSRAWTMGDEPVNRAIGWRFNDPQGNEWRILEAHHDQGVYLVGTGFDESRGHGLLNPKGYDEINFVDEEWTA